MRWPALISAFVFWMGHAVAEPVVLAAASTDRALSAAIEQSGIKALTSYAASGVLARQIEQGAPADLFVSANPKWMEYLVDRGLVAGEAVRTLMSNSLVLIAPPDAPDWTEVPIETRLQGEMFAIADPAVAPVGAYGKTALEELGLWEVVKEHVVPMRNTLSTVATVAAGEAQLGLVYASDAMDQPVKVLWHLPQDSHPVIRYLIAPLGQGGDAEAAGALLAFLGSDAGRTVLASNGFLTGTAP